MRAGVSFSNQVARTPSVDDDRAAKVARLELVRPGVTTAATLAHERTLPVVEGLRELVPSGVLQRGSSLASHGAGATSFALGLVSEAVRAGSFLAVVAPRSFGLGTCLDHDIPLRRVVQFAIPDRIDEGGAGWAQLVAAIIEGFDLVVIADRRRVTASQARQLVARNRERGSVLVRAGGPAWPDAPDLRFDLHEPQWNGLGQGHGHLRSRLLSVQVAGRRWHGTHRSRPLLLPGERGIELLERSPVPTSEPATVTPLVAAADRFAGSDIDEMLDAVDAGPEPATESEVTPPASPSAFGTVA